MYAVRDARVGGMYWAPRLSINATIVLRPTPDNLDRLLEQAERRPDDAVAVFDSEPAATISARLHEAGISHRTGPFDPWSALSPGTTLLADLSDEWTLVATIVGCQLPLNDRAIVRARLEGALLNGMTYRDCFTGEAISPLCAVAIAAEWRRATDRTQSIAAAAGIAWWKKQAMERFLWMGRGALPPICNDAGEAVGKAEDRGGGVAVWPSRAPEGLTEAARERGIPLIAVEDGFIRSVGLGAGLHPPSSIIVDTRGIYYDPRTPSDLEHFLEHGDFDTPLLARAARLRESIVAYGISKYASDAEAAARPRASDRRIVLVAGQVEDDQSVLTGGGDVEGNLDLLKRTRALEPDAHILFKPHPDVDAGHRAGKVPDHEMLAHADTIVRGESMAALFKRVDAVHVLTSLTGFEALLRGLDVTTHGRPFYAGWGLTRDLGGPFPRRTRRLDLDALVAASLLLYPLYLDPETQLPCPAEVLLERFRHQRKPKWTPITIARGLQGRIAKLFGTSTD